MRIKLSYFLSYLSYLIYPKHEGAHRHSFGIGNYKCEFNWTYEPKEKWIPTDKEVNVKLG